MASPIVIPISSTKFQLDKTIVAPGGSVTVDIGASTDHDVLDAILENKTFPDRPEGKIELGSIDLKAETGKTFAFNAGQTTIGFKASAEFKTGLGVFNAAADAIGSLQLQDCPQLNLSIPGSATDKYLVLLWGYDVNGSFSGSHPIGVLGSVTFGAESARDSIYAVWHRFPAATDARTAIADTLGSWRFPRQVRTARDLKPGSWLVAEIDGSLAVHISAQLGYDFNMVREAKLLGLTRNLGAKIDAGLKATFGTISSISTSWRGWRGGEIEGLVQTNAPLYPGFSGGPLVDADGRVVGMNSWVFGRGDGRAIAMDVAERVVASLRSEGRIKRPYLGIGTQEVPLPEAVKGRVNQDSGLLIVAVEPQSPADKAGLMQGDTLVALDGTATKSLEDLYSGLRKIKVGATQTVKVVRAGELKEFPVTVGEAGR